MIASPKVEMVNKSLAIGCTSSKYHSQQVVSTQPCSYDTYIIIMILFVMHNTVCSMNTTSISACLDLETDNSQLNPDFQVNDNT
jgi:hypothetical protein